MENQTPVSQPPLPLPPPPPVQPDTKKLKTSTTTDSDDEDRNATISQNKTPTFNRTKIAILLAYCGAGYQGMQKNPGAKTIEGDLEEALYFCGAVPESDRGCHKRFDFARSARTDKGVSAVGQVVSGKFIVDEPGFVERLSNNLTDQFRVFGYRRVATSFSAKKNCDRRRYVYLLPVFALDPAAHRDRESVLASVGSGNELLKCLKCSERGRKVFVPGGGSGSEGGVQSGVSSNTWSALCESAGFNAVNGVGNGQDDNTVKDNVFHYGDKERRRFNSILKQYEGTHNFHNFTTRTKATDPSANRHIITFHADTTVTIGGIEFVKCEVVGKSFMLHQIRKMIGFAVAIMRNCAPESFIETGLQQDVKINVPTAPEVGLYLEECFFSSYNQNLKDTHEEVSMKDYAQEAEKFKLKHIYPHIASTEHKEGAVAVWLHSLNYRNYPDLGPKEVAGTQTEETSRINMDSLNYRNHPNLGPEENGGANEVSGTQTKEATRCNWNALKYRSHISPSCFIRHPEPYYEKPTILEIDLEHLATTMKNRLNLVLPFVQELRNRYGGGVTETAITDTIVSDVNMMVDTAMSVTYNRLRLILQSHEPTVFIARMNPKSPLSNKHKFPAFISSALGSIGPLRIMDGLQDMLVVYATSADRSQTYGRAQHFDFKSGNFIRLIANLAAIGVPLAPIGVKGGNRQGSFYPTMLLDRKDGLWEFTATCHYSHYTPRDITSAWLTLNDDPALRAFPDCSLRIECCTNPDVVNAVIAARPEGVPDDLDGATAPTRPIGLLFNVNVFGVRPAVAAEGGTPAVPAAVYIVGRGTKRYFCTTLGRGLTEHDMTLMLREYILEYDSSWTDRSFGQR